MWGQGCLGGIGKTPAVVSSGCRRPSRPPQFCRALKSRVRALCERCALRGGGWEGRNVWEAWGWGTSVFPGNPAPAPPTWARQSPPTPTVLCTRPQGSAVLPAGTVGKGPSLGGQWRWPWRRSDGGQTLVCSPARRHMWLSDRRQTLLLSSSVFHLYSGVIDACLVGGGWRQGLNGS